MVQSGTGKETAPSTSPAKDEKTRGWPHYEKLKSDLRELIEAKRANDADLDSLERRIAEQEAEYLERTAAAGNIIKGFDNYIKASSGGTTSAMMGGGTATRRKGGVSDTDRIFSRSSVAWMTRDGGGPLSINVGHGNLSRGESATPVTASGRDTPVSLAGLTKGQKNKKKNARDNDSVVSEDRPNKRGKITWGRD